MLFVFVVDEGLHDDVVSVVLELIRRKNFAIGLGFDLVVVVIRCWLLRLHDGCGNILYDSSGTSSAVLFGGALMYGRVSSVC